MREKTKPVRALGKRSAYSRSFRRYLFVEFSADFIGDDKVAMVLGDNIFHGNELDESLKVIPMDRGSAWLDTGIFESMNDASEYIQVIEKRTGLKIGCPEEVAFREGFIDTSQLKKLADDLVKSGYGKHLENLNS